MATVPTAKVEYTAILLGATGNVGGRILHLLVQSRLCRKVIVVTRRNVPELAIFCADLDSFSGPPRMRRCRAAGSFKPR